MVVIFGLIYGKGYFKFCEPYGNPKSSLNLGMYILSLKWWNVKFNWYTMKNQWHVDISVTVPVSIKEKSFREYILIMSSTGVKTCTIDIK